MPISADDDGGLTISPHFLYEASFHLEHPNPDPGAVTAALSTAPHGSWPPGEGSGPAGEGRSVWACRLDSAGELAPALLGFTELLAPKARFLERVRDEGGRYGYTVLCLVDFNACLHLDVSLLRRLAELRIDLTLHALAADSAE